MEKQQAYASHDGERFLDAVQNARLVANAERYYRIMYYGSRASWNLRDSTCSTRCRRCSRITARTARPSSGRTIRTSAMPPRRKCRRAANSISVNSAARHSATAATRSASAPITARWRRPRTGTGRWRSRPCARRCENSYEKLCHAADVPRFMLALRDQTAGAVRGLMEPRLERAIGVIYRPESELASHYFEAATGASVRRIYLVRRKQSGDAVQDQGTGRPAGHLSIRPVMRRSRSVTAIISRSHISQCSSRAAPRGCGWSNHLPSVIETVRRVP